MPTTLLDVVALPPFCSLQTYTLFPELALLPYEALQLGLSRFQRLEIKYVVLQSAGGRTGVVVVQECDRPARPPPHQPRGLAILI